MVDRNDRQAILALGSKIFEYLDDNQTLTGEIAERQAKVTANHAAISDCVAGLRVFKIDLNQEGAWDRFAHEYSTEIGELLYGPRQPVKGTGIDGPKSQSFIATKQPISVLILERLRDVGFHGSKALPLRNFLKQQYNIETHYKTVGMTLYRLSQESPQKVHRKGHTWFFGPPQEETKNPGDDTPGQTSLLDVEGGTDA